jgi:hypothetical protein
MEQPMANQFDRDSRRFVRESAAKFLTEQGLPTSPATLATLASRGGGPSYAVYGRRAIYSEADLIDWAIKRLGKPAATFSEHQAREVDGRPAERAATRVERKAREVA